jgi:hypothetical protein
MNRILLLALLLLTNTIAAQSRNLLALGREEFFEGQPMCTSRPPLIQVSTDGRILFERDGRYWVGKVPRERLHRFSESLQRNRALQRTQFIDVRLGDSVAYHGGMQWYRYGEGRNARLVVMTAKPWQGPIADLDRELRALIPSSFQLFVPQCASVSVVKVDWQSPAQASWPFAQQIDLREVSRTHAVQIGELSFQTADPFDLTDPDILRFLFENGLSNTVEQDGQSYFVIVSDAPGFLPPMDAAHDPCLLWESSRASGR